MFSVLNLQEHISQGFWEKLTGWIKRNPVGAELIKSGPVRYWEVKWEQRGNRPVPWGQIQELARWAPAGILLPKGVEPPEGIDLPLVPGEGLQRHLLQEAAVAAVGASRAEPLKLSVAVFDPDGRLGSLAVRFLPYAATVKVITQNPEQLLDAQRQAMVEYGAALLVTDEPGRCPGLPGSGGHRRAAGRIRGRRTGTVFLGKAPPVAARPERYRLRRPAAGGLRRRLPLFSRSRAVRRRPLCHPPVPGRLLWRRLPAVGRAADAGPAGG